MTDKELKRLSKIEILEILRSQEVEIEAMRAQIVSLEERLKSRKLEVQKAGSIAEAAMAVNHVFEAAQQAADQYLMNVTERIDEEAAKYIRIKSSADQQAAVMMTTTENECTRREKKEKEYVDSLWNSLKQKLDAYILEHEGLKDRMTTEDLQSLSVSELREKHNMGEAI